MAEKTIFSTIKRRIDKLIYRFKNFGFLVPFFDYLYEITQSKLINIIKHKIIANYLKTKYAAFVSERRNNTNIPPQGDIPKQIWISWWNGIDMMPPLVSACYQSTLRYSNGYKVNLVTKYNYKDYITIPDCIIKKIENESLSLTHFSEIIRTALLYNHGGLWLDATWLITSPIEIQDLPFFTIRTFYNSPRNIANGRWQCNIIGSVQKYHLFGFLFDFLVNYWSSHKYLLTYHLFDYAINLAYESFPSVKKSFDIIKPMNKNDFIVNNLKNGFDLPSYENAVKDTIFHKLSYKRVGSDTLPGNKLTYYGYILNMYL